MPRPVSGEGAVILAKQRRVHCTPERWERIRRRARKAKMPVSRFGELCCRRAAADADAPPPAPPGHPLALSEDDQRRLLADSRGLARAAGIPVVAPGGGRVVLPLDAAVRFLLLSEEAGG